MINLENQENLFHLLGRGLKQKGDYYIVGGSAMLYYKAKEKTKDIDIVCQTTKDREILLQLLKDLGFKDREFRFLYFNKKNVPLLLSRGQTRIDLFYRRIICFDLSHGMIDRIRKVYEYGNFVAHIVAPEDILLLKCATERPGDREDAKSLVDHYNLKWDSIIEEAQAQTRPGEELFVVFLDDFLHELKEDLHADVPKEVLKKIRQIAEKALIEHAGKKKRSRVALKSR
ncbi:nucleotidyltransferase [Candidatus Woesearchaeota archaeon]|nr:nucleotidyltransferase [Candidatus Woesearchaeota archaeon]